MVDLNRILRKIFGPPRVTCIHCGRFSAIHTGFYDREAKFECTNCNESFRKSIGGADR